MGTRPAELSEETAALVYRAVRHYRREAYKCQEAKAHLAGAVMATAALEGALLAFANVYLEEVPDAALPMRRGGAKELLEWTLADLLGVAKKCKWLPVGLEKGQKWSTRSAKLGDYAEAAREVRNLVHTGRHVQDLPRQRVSARQLSLCMVVSW